MFNKKCRVNQIQRYCIILILLGSVGPGCSCISESRKSGIGEEESFTIHRLKIWELRIEEASQLGHDCLRYNTLAEAMGGLEAAGITDKVDRRWMTKDGWGNEFLWRVEHEGGKSFICISSPSSKFNANQTGGNTLKIRIRFRLQND